jgi:uncharacterized protein YacL|tara:strand:+ start:186 stop:416 length:231 start_codon:yes stop_codon:yes gene_type:complete
MDLYEPKTEQSDDDTTKITASTIGIGVGLILGALAAASLEALLIWLILTYLVGVTLTWLQVLGIMLVVNGIMAKFK